MHRLQELVRLHRQGKRVREVARLLGMSPNTERCYRSILGDAGLLEGDADALPELSELRAVVEEAMPARLALPQHRSSVERWRASIVKLAECGAGPKAIHDRLRLEEPDYSGSYDAVKRLHRAWRRSRGVEAEDVDISVETAPGEVAQVDFGYVGKLFDPQQQRMRKAYVFVMVLGYSRHMFARIVFDQKVDTWLQLHVRAFAALGGVPRTIVPDNLKAAVIRAAFGTDRDATALNRSYRELARHYGFQIDPAPPRSPKKKGKVESGVKYVKRNFFKAREVDLFDITDAQSELERWVAEIAGLREHGTTRWQPIVVFDEQERAELLPLPTRPYVPVEWKKARVQSNAHVIFDRREYSVHWTHIGRDDAWVRATPDTVAIYIDDERIQTHDRRGKGHRSTVDSDLPEGRRELRHRSRSYWIDRAGLIDDDVAAYVTEIFESDDVLSQLRVAQGVITLLEKHPRERAIATCRRARFFGNFTYRGVRDILRKGLDFEPLPMTLFAANNTGFHPRFSRVPEPPPKETS